MEPLRERMMEDLQLKGYSQSTQKLYLSAVRQLCEHFNKPPGRITEGDLRDYFLYGKNVKKWSREKIENRGRTKTTNCYEYLKYKKLF